MNNESGVAPGRGAQGKLRALVVLAALLASPAVLADSRGDAKRHFRDGMSLIAAGQVERGIAELKQAYAIKPHPDVLYDIAKAYVDLGNIPEALNYFRQYVATDPEDKDQVLSVMARLETAIGKKPGSTIEVPAETAQGNVDVQKLLAQLEALIQQQQQHGAPAVPAKGTAAPGKPAAKPAAAPEEDMFEAETITARSRATAKEISQELGSNTAHADLGDEIFDEQVVTASARSSSEMRAPTSLTVINEDEIRLSGAATVPEILRRVPGIDVAEMNPSDTNISIRGFNRRLSNKVLVLVDGRSVYQDFLGTTLWPMIDVSVQDISRIEVIRGPASALYGANAFAGVVNIITKVGDDASGPRVFVQGGDHNTMQGGVSVGGRDGKMSYRTTAAYDRADKWTKDVADSRVDMTSQFTQPNRSREVERADMAANWDFGKVQLRTGAGFDNMNAGEIVPLGALRTFGSNGQAGFARLEIGSGQTRFKAFYNALRMNSGPEYWPTGITSVLASIRSDVIDASAQTGFDFRFLGEHHVNFGAGYRYKGVRWGYLAARPDGTPWEEHHFNATVQEQWDMSRKVSLLLSYRVDRNPLLDANNVNAGGLVQSPRGTLLVELKPDHVLRFAFGSAFRTATFLESYADLFAPIPNQPALGLRFQGSQDLRPEEMLQGEIGYRGRFGTFQPEVVVYGERVGNLITDGALRRPANPSESRDPITGQYIIGYTGFENEPGHFFGVGTEVSAKWSPADGVDLIASYAYEKMFACNTTSAGSSCTTDSKLPNQVSATLGNTAEHKANFTALWRTKANLDLGMDLHYVSGVSWVERSFDVNQQGGVLYTPYAMPAYTLINGRVGYRWIKDKLETGVSVYNLLGDEHREHPFGNAIGRRILFSATGSF